MLSITTLGDGLSFLRLVAPLLLSRVVVYVYEVVGGYYQDVWGVLLFLKGWRMRSWRLCFDVLVDGTGERDYCFWIL